MNIAILINEFLISIQNIILHNGIVNSPNQYVTFVCFSLFYILGFFAFPAFSFLVHIPSIGYSSSVSPCNFLNVNFLCFSSSLLNRKSFCDVFLEKPAHSAKFKKCQFLFFENIKSRRNLVLLSNKEHEYREENDNNNNNNNEIDEDEYNDLIVKLENEKNFMKQHESNENELKPVNNAARLHYNQKNNSLLNFPQSSYLRPASSQLPAAFQDDHAESHDVKESNPFHNNNNGRGRREDGKSSWPRVSSNRGYGEGGKEEVFGGEAVDWEEESAEGGEQRPPRDEGDRWWRKGRGGGGYSNRRFHEGSKGGNEEYGGDNGQWKKAIYEDYDEETGSIRGGRREPKFTENSRNVRGWNREWRGNREEYGKRRDGGEWDRQRSTNRYSRNTYSDFDYESIQPAANFEEMKSKKFQKDFYVQHEDVANRSQQEIQRMMEEDEIIIESPVAYPRPINNFEEAMFPEYISKILKKSNFTTPSSIQKIGWPLILKGRDTIGIAQTGSGKTLAFLLPAIVHIKEQLHLKTMGCPMALVLAPTRELALQIQNEAYKFSKYTNIKSVCVYGGASRFKQIRDIQVNQPHIIIATPGRLLDFIQNNIVYLSGISYLVLDEADRMLDMGFEKQIKSICSLIRPDKQTLLFSATFPKEIKSLATQFCNHETVKIQVGKSELQANPNIRQLVLVVPSVDLSNAVISWLKENVKYNEKVIIFCKKKTECNHLSYYLSTHQIHTSVLHGDKLQNQRDRIIEDFKRGLCNVLIATDVASRGLDIKDITHVINYDIPTNIENYIHRIGRTGRGGSKGEAVTFFGYDYFSPEKRRMARDIAHVINDVGQQPPPDLLRIANMNNRRY